MTIELDREDLRLLTQMVDERVGTIRPEIHHTMNFEYRADLKDTEVRLKALLTRFRDALGEVEQATAAASSADEYGTGIS